VRLSILLEIELGQGDFSRRKRAHLFSAFVPRLLVKKFASVPEPTFAFQPMETWFFVVWNTSLVSSRSSWLWCSGHGG
jgi:hypothetical protein